MNLLNLFRPLCSLATQPMPNCEFNSTGETAGSNDGSRTWCRGVGACINKSLHQGRLEMLNLALLEVCSVA